MPKDWVKIPGFPDYEIDQWGGVRDRHTKEELAKHPIGETYYYVLIDKDGNPKIRVVWSLIRSTFKEEEDD